MKYELESLHGKTVHRVRTELGRGVVEGSFSVEFLDGQILSIVWKDGEITEASMKRDLQWRSV